MRQTYLAVQTQMLDHAPRSQAMWEELGSGLGIRLPAVVELVALFTGHVGGARKWPENEATAMNCQ